MKTKQVKTIVKENPTHIEIETFRNVMDSSYWIRQMEETSPSCFNGMVSIKKYKITFELIEEPENILLERLIKLWEECDNHHNWQPLRSAGNELGVELNMDRCGINKKPKF